MDIVYVVVPVLLIAIVLGWALGRAKLSVGKYSNYGSMVCDKYSKSQDQLPGIRAIFGQIRGGGDT